jgi:hypothetical protein
MAMSQRRYAKAWDLKRAEEKGKRDIKENKSEMLLDSEGKEVFRFSNIYY